MKSLYIYLIPFLLMACSTSAGQLSETSAETATPTASLTIHPTATFSPTPTNTPTNTPTITLSPTAPPTYTPSPTATPAEISRENIQSLSRVKKWGKDGFFAAIQNSLVSPTGQYFILSGEVDEVLTSILYETDTFTIVERYQNLGHPAWSADESKLLFTNGGLINVRDFQDNHLINEIQGSREPIKTISIYRDQIAFVDSQNVFRIVDALTGNEYFSQQLPNSKDPFVDVAMQWSPGGEYLSIVGIDEIVRVWDGEQVRDLKGHEMFVDSASWSPAGDMLATSGKESDAYVWRMSNNNKVFNFSGHTYWVSNIAWSPDGKSIATADAAGTIRIRDAVTGRLQKQVSHFASPNFFSWSPDSRMIAVNYGRNVFKVFDIETGDEIIPPDEITNQVDSFYWLGDGTKILFTDYDARVQLWDRDADETSMIINPRIGTVVSFSISPDGQKIALAEFGGNIHLIDSDTGEIISTLETNANFSVENLTWSYNNELIAFCGRYDNSVSLMDVQNGEIINTVSNVLFGKELKLAWSPEEMVLLIADWDGNLFVYDVESAKIIQSLRIHQSPILATAWSFDGNKVAAVGFRGEVYVWETENWKKVAYLQSSTDFQFFVDVVFSSTADSIFLTTTSDQNYDADIGTFSYSRFQEWDVQSQEILKEWIGDFCLQIALSQNGDLLASSAGEIWDAETGESIYKLEVFENDKYILGMLDIIWSPDGRYLIFPAYTVDYFGIKP